MGSGPAFHGKIYLQKITPAVRTAMVPVIAFRVFNSTMTTPPAGTEGANRFLKNLFTDMKMKFFTHLLISGLAVPSFLWSSLTFAGPKMMTYELLHPEGDLHVNLTPDGTGVVVANYTNGYLQVNDKAYFVGSALDTWNNQFELKNSDLSFYFFRNDAKYAYAFGKELGPFNVNEHPAFFNKDKHAAISVRKQDDYLIIGGKKYGPADEFSEVSFNRDASFFMFQQKRYRITDTAANWKIKWENFKIFFKEAFGPASYRSGPAHFKEKQGEKSIQINDKLYKHAHYKGYWEPQTNSPGCFVITYPKKKAMFLVLNDTEFGPYDRIDSDVLFSENQACFLAECWTENLFVIVSGRSYGPLIHRSDPGSALIRKEISRNGNGFGVCYRKENKIHVLFNGKHYGPYPNGKVTYFLLRGSGEDFILAIRPDSQQHTEKLFVKDRHVGDFQWIRLQSRMNSPHLIFTHRKDGHQHLYVNGDSYGPYEEIDTDMWFSSFLENDTLAFRYSRDNAYYYLINERICGPYDELSRLYLSDEGRQFGFGYEKDGKRYANINGDRFSGVDKIRDIKFASDGKQYMVWYKTASKSHILFNGKKAGPYKYVTLRGFSRNAKWALAEYEKKIR